MSSMTLSIMMASDNFWDEKVALIGGGKLSMTDCCADLSEETGKLLLVIWWR